MDSYVWTYGASRTKHPQTHNVHEPTCKTACHQHANQHSLSTRNSMRTRMPNGMPNNMRNSMLPACQTTCQTIACQIKEIPNLVNTVGSSQRPQTAEGNKKEKTRCSGNTWPLHPQQDIHVSYKAGSPLHKGERRASGQLDKLVSNNNGRNSKHARRRHHVAFAPATGHTRVIELGATCT